jgi:hypothetical protein
VIIDAMNSECLNAFIKTLVNHHKTSIYLDSKYATVDKWQGKSELLQQIFAQLKLADKKPGYFNPVCLADLVV